MQTIITENNRIFKVSHYEYDELTDSTTFSKFEDCEDYVAEFAQVTHGEIINKTTRPIAIDEDNILRGEKTKMEQKKESHLFTEKEREQLKTIKAHMFTEKQMKTALKGMKVKKQK